MLQADLSTLRESYDHIYIMMPEGIRRGGSFFDQVLGVCDSVFIMVGAGKTPRSSFNYVRRHIQASGKPSMGIALDASTRVVRSEMESKV